MVFPSLQEAKGKHLLSADTTQYNFDRIHGKKKKLERASAADISKESTKKPRYEVKKSICFQKTLHASYCHYNTTLIICTAVIILHYKMFIGDTLISSDHYSSTSLNSALYRLHIKHLTVK